VIVAFESRRLLRDCLASLREHRPRLPTRIFVVDNGSDDGTPDMVREEFPEVELDVAAANLGFSRANNRAIARGTGKYVLALNPDTRVGERGLDALLALMESHPEIGICGCRLQLEDGSFDHAARRSFPTPLGALAHFTGIGRRAGAPARLAQYRAPEVEAGPVDAVNGAFMLMRRSALDQVGLFDEGYWMYMEDLDLCYRFKQAGWVVWYEPNVTVAHIKGASSGAHRSPRLNYAFHYGMFRFYRKHYAPDRSRATNAFIYSGIALKLAVSVLHSAVDRRLMPHLRPPKVG
jgi:N-acetylglucosaminyl-diphospho-decaprenol L-rhamnosyltransferase